MKPIYFVLSFLLMGLFISCTDNDEPLKLNKLKLKSNLNSTHIPINKEVEFKLTGDDYVDYTDQMSLLINGETVESNTYTFEQTGEYSVRASANNLTSNTLVFEVSQGLNIDRKSLLKNQAATFTLYDVGTGDNITDEGTFYVNNEPISGHTFSSSNTGEYQVYAEYMDENGEMQTTDTDTLNVVVPTQRALVEDYTGTWCGYCPRLQGYISQLLEMTNDAVVMALHASSSDTNPDPYEYENIDQLVEAYNTYHQFPLGKINRTISWTDGDPSTVMDYLGGESNIGIAATTRVNDSQLSVDVRIASTNGLSNRKIVVAVLENHLFHDQTNYLNSDPNSEWFETGNPIPDYENDHVLRHAMTNIFGDDIPSTEALQDFTKSYSMNLDDYLKNPENGEVAILILDDEGTVLQAKKIGLTEKSEFE